MKLPNINTSINQSIKYKLAGIIILFQLIELVLSRNKIEKICMNKNNFSWEKQLQPSDCTSVDASCCFIDIFYKLPDIEVKDKYCFVNYVQIDKFIDQLKKNLYNDIHRHIRREWSNHYKLYYIGSNLNYNITDNKTYWCPLNCTRPNITILNCNEEDFLPNALELKAQIVGSEFITEKNSPPNDLSNCKKIEDDKCLLFANPYTPNTNTDVIIEDNNKTVSINNNIINDEGNPFSDLERSLNLQYGFSKCFNVPCNSTDIERVKLEEDLFIGNKRLIKNDIEVFPDKCKEIPPKLDDILQVKVVCPENYVPTKNLILE